MRTYTVLRSRRSYGTPALEAEQMVFVKEGFCWPALFVPLLWCLYHRLWLVMAAYLVGVAVIFGVVSGFDLDPTVGFALFIGAQALFAAEANDLLRMRLAARAFEITGLAYGRNLFDAEMTFFKQWVQNVGEDEERQSLVEADVSFRSTSEPRDPNAKDTEATVNIGAPA